MHGLVYFSLGFDFPALLAAKHMCVLEVDLLIKIAVLQRTCTIDSTTIR